MKSKGTKLSKIKTIRKVENIANEPLICIEEKPVDDFIAAQEADLIMAQEAT